MLIIPQLFILRNESHLLQGELISLGEKATDTDMHALLPTPLCNGLGKNERFLHLEIA